MIKTINKTDKTFFVAARLLSSKEIAIADGINGLLERYKSLQIVSSTLQRDFRIFILLISMPVILLAVIFGFYFATQITKPLGSLVEGTKKIAQGIYGYFITQKAKDELGHLIEAFNFMSLELYKNKNKLFEAEKMAAWREVAQKLAHEVKNPLTPIKLAAERLLRSYHKDPKKFEEVLTTCSKTISEEVDRLKDLVNEFSQFARFPLSNFSEENMFNLLTDIASIYRETYPLIDVTVENRLNEEKDHTIKVDKNQIKQIIINLFENSIEALNNITTPKINILISKLIKNEKSYMQISISDNGCGIPKNFYNKVFYPQSSLKGQDRGLGLSIAKNIIEEHKGLIYFYSEEKKGATFIFEIPYSWRQDE